jgi:2-oxoglutarate ferredoxin oxidoreductase subunit gamma
MNILVAGFGGQGILFAGKFLAYVGLFGGQEVSWLPSYGAEMRGGTANCSVILSKERIGSPVVPHPDVFVCMNLPSLDKFEKDIVPGGMLLVDSSLITREPARNDIVSHAVPATRLASEGGMVKLANMIMIGKLMRESGLCGPGEAERIMRSIIPESRKALVAQNMRAIELGYGFA